MTNEELAYIAGFFDGEGSLTIHENCAPSPRGMAPNHTLQVSIGNTDPRVLEWIHAEYGGSLLQRKRAVGRAHHRNFMQWIIRARMALRFLEEIRPFLRMKAEQVDIAIAYQRSKTMKGPARTSIAELQWREDQRAEIRRLNAKEWISDKIQTAC